MLFDLVLATPTGVDRTRYGVIFPALLAESIMR
jgi:hypothetical protein